MQSDVTLTNNICCYVRIDWLLDRPFVERLIHLVLRDSDPEHSELVDQPDASVGGPATLTPIPEETSREAAAEALGMSAALDQFDKTRNETAPLVESTPPPARVGTGTGTGTGTGPRRVGVVLRSHSERVESAYAYTSNTSAAYATPSVPTRAERRARRQSDTLFVTLIWSLAVVEVWSHPLLLAVCLPLLALLLATSLQGCCPLLQKFVARVRRPSLLARVSRTGQKLQRSAHAHQYLPGPLLSLLWLYAQADRLVCNPQFAFAISFTRS